MIFDFVWPIQMFSFLTAARLFSLKNEHADVVKPPFVTRCRKLTEDYKLIKNQWYQER